MRLARPLLLGSIFLPPIFFAIACSATGDDNAFNAGSSGPGSSGSGAGDGIGGGLISDSGTFGDANCGSSTFANAVPASILVVLDRSGSMAGGDGTPDKWGPTVSALGSMMAVAPAELGVGLLPFAAGNFNSGGMALCLIDATQPGCDVLLADGGCKDVDPQPVVAVGPLSSTAGPINAWLASNGPDGGTPTLFALKTAYDIMRVLPVEGERYVLLLTDGEPNLHQPAINVGPFTIPETNVECGDDVGVIEAETLAASGGAPAVKTFVIGAPGSESAGQFLSQLAVNGLTQKSASCSPAAKDCHYQIGQASFQTELEAALNAITGSISDCVFAIPQGTEEVDPNLVNVVVETSGGITETYKDTSHQDGWDYTDSSQTKVELFGPACEAYKAEKGAKVTIILGCETVVK